MMAERWKQIEGLYYRLLELDPGERAAFIEKECAGDAELRREVESLLAVNERVRQSGGFLERNAQEIVVSDMATEQFTSKAGQEIGHYRVISLLGRGGMGEVYLALDLRLGRKVALKFLPREFAQDRERVERFKREARAASALNHPNIITIFEIDHDPNTGDLFIAAEFVEGETLRERLAGATMGLKETLDVAVQIAAALAEAHAAGIIHRDIKPENIMLRPDGIVKVLDFGLAKRVELLLNEQAALDSADKSSREFRSIPGMVMGTPQYMSPEQIRGAEVDARTDVFSLGVVLYEMMAGRAPFDRDSTNEVIAAILYDEPSPLQSCAREATDGMARIVHRAMAKEPEQRHQTVEDLRNELMSLKDDPAGGKNYIETLSQDDLMKLRPPKGGLPVDSKFYIHRPTDEEFRAAIECHDSIVRIKGPRQVGKTSLLARGLEQARAAGDRVVLTDLQSPSKSDLASADAFYLWVANRFAEELDLGVVPNAVWKAHLGPNDNFEWYMRREVLGKIPSPLVWGLDEVDLLFTCDYRSEVFGLFRSWHNARSLAPTGPWQRLTLVIAHATEAHLFIKDMNQSPFNVGTLLTLKDFTFEQVAELNRRYGSLLKDAAEKERFFNLLGGHPYLTHYGVWDMRAHRRNIDGLEAVADHDDGPFGDHLRRLAESLAQDPELGEAMRGILQGKPCASKEILYRLQSAGVITEDSEGKARPRCQLYAIYLKKRL
jgi:serine/threonine protein kinase